MTTHLKRRKRAKAVSTRRLEVRDIAGELGLSTRQLARLARKGVPGVTRSANGYHFDWIDCPELREWIESRKKTRKGNRKQKPVRKTGLSAVQLFTRAAVKMERIGENYLRNALDAASESKLHELKMVARRLENFCKRAQAWISQQLQGR